MSFLLVPGAGGDSYYWHRLVPLLVERGDLVATVDLPAADESAGLAAYADAIVDAAVGGPLTLVAQSMGAFSAAMAAERLDVRRLVLVNAMVPAPGESPGQWWEGSGHRAARGDAAFDPVEDFFHDVPSHVREEAFSRGAPVQADRPFSDPWPLAGWPPVPTDAVVGRDDRLFPAPFQTKLLRERIGIQPRIVPGGHLLALSNPVALARQL